MIELQEGVIYNEIHSIIIKKKPNEEKECRYRITVELNRGHIGKTLIIRITDDLDYTFMFSLVLAQEDFIVLKSDQGLRVDFENFPRQFTKLLDDCRSPEKFQFTLMIDDSDSDHQSLQKNGLFLKVIERNEFKYLCHLSLRIAPGTDEDIKQHLCNKLKVVQDLLAQEKSKNSRIISELEETSNNLSINTRRLNDLEIKLAEEKSSIRLEASQQLSGEREKHNKELKELEAKHYNAVQELQSNIDLLTHKNRMCHEAKSCLEATLSERTVQKETAEKDVARLTDENADLKLTVSNLEHRLMECEQILTSLRRKHNTTEEANKELNAAIIQARRETQTAREREAGVTANLRHCERQLQHTSSKLNVVKQEVVRMEDDLALKRKKIGNMLSVAQMLEGQLEKTKEELASKSKQLEILEKNDMGSQSKISDLTKSLADAEQKLKEQDETIKRQYEVNAYLHRKLTEAESSSEKSNQSKNVKLSDSIIAKNLPSLIKHSTVTASISGNASLPPWLTNSGTTGNASAFSCGDSIRVNETSIKTRLDPSYLLPDNEDKKTNIINKSTFTASAYFPRPSTS